MAAKHKFSRRYVTRFTRDGVELRVPVNALNTGISKKMVPYSRAMATKGLNPDPESDNWRPIGSMSHGKVRFNVKDNDGLEINSSADDFHELLWGDEHEDQSPPRPERTQLEFLPPPEPDEPVQGPPPPKKVKYLVGQVAAEQTRQGFDTPEEVKKLIAAYQLRFPNPVFFVCEVDEDVLAAANAEARAKKTV